MSIDPMMCLLYAVGWIGVIAYMVHYIIRLRAKLDKAQMSNQRFMTAHILQCNRIYCMEERYARLLNHLGNIKKLRKINPKLP